jgi:hypothetical protein
VKQFERLTLRRHRVPKKIIIMLALREINLEDGRLKEVAQSPKYWREFFLVVLNLWDQLPECQSGSSVSYLIFVNSGLECILKVMLKYLK